jgi:hypothetical protein
MTLSCHYKRLKRFFILSKNLIIKPIEIVLIIIYKAFKDTAVYGLPAAIIYVTFESLILNSKVESTGIYILGPLATLIALTSLLYSRARAVPTENQETCLLAADRAFKATIYYGVAVLWGALVTALKIILTNDEVAINNSSQLLFLVYLPSIWFLMISYLHIFKTIKQVFEDLRN